MVIVSQVKPLQLLSVAIIFTKQIKIFIIITLIELAQYLLELKSMVYVQVMFIFIMYFINYQMIHKIHVHLAM